MKEQLITFDTAKLAKEKGFNVPVIYYFEDYNGELTHYHLSKKDWNNRGKQYSIMYSAPSQSLLQKWLREVHHIVIDNTCYFSLTKFTLKLHTFENGEFIGTVIDSVRDVKNRVTYKSYEEALEEGLIEALKLLK